MRALLVLVGWMLFPAHLMPLLAEAQALEVSQDADPATTASDGAAPESEAEPPNLLDLFADAAAEEHIKMQLIRPLRLRMNQQDELLEMTVEVVFSLSEEAGAVARYVKAMKARMPACVPKADPPSDGPAGDDTVPARLLFECDLAQ